MSTDIRQMVTVAVCVVVCATVYSDGGMQAILLLLQFAFSPLKIIMLVLASWCNRLSLCL